MFKRFHLNNKKILLLIGVFAGVILSVVTVKVLDYTDSPEFCSSCHIMTQAHTSFTDSNHAELACADCHLPHDTLVNKYVNKAKAGIGHVYFNTLGVEQIPKVLHTTENSKEIITENCISCHKNTLDNVSHDAKDSCSSCHEAVPHNSDFKTEDYFKPPKSKELLERKGGTMENG